jgi:aspartyl-tRNA(Asn)/glutamyl-tRNA(Gln) amidotransferase subunit A
MTELSRRGFLAGAAAAGAAMVPLLDPPLSVAARRRRAGRAGLTPPPRARMAATAAKSAPGLPPPKPIAARHANPADLGVLEAASLLQAGLLSSGELTQACQERIAQRNGAVTFEGSASEINAWIRLYPEMAQSLAAAADARLARARAESRAAPALCGVPLGLKDLYAVKGCRSRPPRRCSRATSQPGTAPPGNGWRAREWCS